MNTLTKLITALLIALQGADASNPQLRAVQKIAQFPAGVWNGTCDAKVLRELPQKCREAINENSRDFEILACNLIQAPGTIGTIPFGMYPTDMLLDTEPGSIGSESLTKVFDDCAMASMIEENCFLFYPEQWSGKYETYSYTTEEEYAESMSTSYGIDTSVGGGYGPVTLSAGFAVSNGNANQESISTKSSGASRRWTQEVGKITFQGCIGRLGKYLDKDFVQKWKNIQRFTPLSDPDLQDLMESGFFIPTEFGFAVKYAIDVKATYQMTTSSSSITSKDALKAGLEVGVGAVSGGIGIEMQNAITKAAKQSNLDMKSETIDYKYGMCNFTKMLDNNATYWSGVLKECANGVKDNISRLDRAAFIPKGGFAHIFDIFDKNNIYINSDAKNKMVEYFSSCSCDNAYDSSTGYTCTGGTRKSCDNNQPCKSAFWFERDGDDRACNKIH